MPGHDVAPPVNGGPTPCLSVVMPCYDELDTIEAIVGQVLAQDVVAELIIVDDGSKDGTRDILATFDDPRVRVLLQPFNQGKGAALRRGFQAATADFVIVQDADLEYDPAEFAKVIAPLVDGKADVVFGSRFKGGDAHRVLYFWHSVGNQMLTLASNMTTNLNITDMETCYKAFRREVIQSIDVVEDRFGIEPEITGRVAAAGWRVYEVGISYDGRTYAEGKKIGWRDGVRALWCIGRYSPTALRRGDASRARRKPAGFAEADGELASTLDNLDDAGNYADWITGLVGKALAPSGPTSILEVGAGHGTFTGRLRSFGTVTACEPSTRAWEELERRYGDDDGVKVVHGDAAAALAGGGHDAAVMINVLEHIEDDTGVLAELAEGLEPGSRVVVFVPAFEALYSDFDAKIGHHRRYTTKHLARVATRAGLQVQDVRYVNAPGALAWLLYARGLGKVPTASTATALYDRLAVPVVRRLEARWSPPLGQSVLGTFTVPRA